MNGETKKGGLVQMSGNKSDVKSGRRDFLKLAGVATVTGGTALAASGSGAEASLAEEKSDGYRETEHVRTYYNSARF